MVWARLDDEILDNPKIAEAGVFGFALHVAAITWCCRNLTDGKIPYARAASLLDMSAVNYDQGNPLALPGGPVTMGGDTGLDVHLVAAHLVDIGLWERSPSGYLIHDFLDYNPSREQVLKERAAARDRRKNEKPERRKSVARPSSERNPNVVRSSGRPVPDPDPVPEIQNPPGVPPREAVSGLMPVVAGNSANDDSQPEIPDCPDDEKPAPKPAKVRYAEAYAEGQREASGDAPFPPPLKKWDDGALARFTQTPGWGQGLRGDELLAAIRGWSRDFRRACDGQPQKHRQFSPEACEEWARGWGWRYKAPRKPQERASVPERPAEPPAYVDASEALRDVSALFAPRAVGGGK